ncbi:MAG: PQQ-binding-like beta-propeller repeat protein, partial [Candidatus Sumerlaeota bacterium]
TPTYDLQTGFLYTLGCDGELRCWNTTQDGKIEWRLNLYDLYKIERRPDVGGGQRDYGFTAAPFIHGEELLVMAGQSAGLVAAFDKRDGKPLWSSQHKGLSAPCGGLTPIHVAGRKAVCALSIKELVIISIEKDSTGQTIATWPWQTEFANNIVTPTVVNNRIILSSAYNISKTVLLEWEQDKLRQVWQAGPHSGVCSPVVYQGRIFFARKNLFCLSLHDGKTLWKGGRFGDDASCVVTSDGLLVVYGDQRLAVVDADAEQYTELAIRNGIVRKNQAWPHVVLANGLIFTKDRMGAIQCFKPENSKPDSEK